MKFWLSILALCICISANIKSQKPEIDITIMDNYSYLIEYKGVKILHLGDCQANIIAIENHENRNYLRDHIPDDLDILFFPIEGRTKYIEKAISFIRFVDAKVSIPMHYWTKDYKNEFIDSCYSGKMLIRKSAIKNRFKYNCADYHSNTKVVISIDAGGMDK